MKKKRISIKEAAEILGMSENSLRPFIQQNKFYFGCAAKVSEQRWSYYINPTLFAEYNRISLEELGEKIKKIRGN